MSSERITPAPTIDTRHPSLRRKTWEAMCELARLRGAINVAAFCYRFVREVCGGRSWCETNEADWMMILRRMGVAV